MSNSNFEDHSWSSEKVEEAIEIINKGGKLKSVPFFEGNINLRKGNVAFELTDYEIKEITKCANDIIYFANTYCMVDTDEGVKTIKLRDYQEDMLRMFKENRYSVVLASRQIGKTICSSIFTIWYALFNFDKNILVLSNKGSTTREIIGKGRTILKNLPFFLKPGITKWDVFEARFDNDCRIIGQNTTKNAAIGLTINVLFIDEFAHIDNVFINTFFENVFPTISSFKDSKCIITSTPNGKNLFYEIYKNSTEKKNEFVNYKVDWWQVPGRDEKWAEAQIANYGGGEKGKEKFNRQYGNQFISSTNLLLNPTTLSRLTKNEKQYEWREIYELEEEFLNYEDLLWHPHLDFNEIRKRDDTYWFFSIDIAEGNGGDYSVINIFQLKVKDSNAIEKVVLPEKIGDFFMLEQVGRFRSNTTSLEDFGKILYVLAFDIFNDENLKMIIEWNSFGGELVKILDSVFPSRNDFGDEIIVKHKHRIDAREKKIGLKIKSDNKTVFCQNFKKHVTQNNINLTCKDTVNECSTFGKNNNGNYQGQGENDDLVMSSIIACEFFNTIDYKDFVEEMFDFIDDDIKKLIDSKLDIKGKDDEYGYDIYDILN